MTKIVYRPAPGDPESVKWGGHEFVAHQEKHVTDQTIIDRAKGNPFFDVDGISKEAERVKAGLVNSIAQAKAGLEKIGVDAGLIEDRQDAEEKALQDRHQAERDSFSTAAKKLHEGFVDQIKKAEAELSKITGTPSDQGVPAGVSDDPNAKDKGDDADSRDPNGALHDEPPPWDPTAPEAPPDPASEVG